MDGHIALHIKAVFMYFPFTPLGFTSFIVFMKYCKFSFNLTFPKDNLPRIECIFPCLSFLNSNFPAPISFTILDRSSHTLPAFGFGISPFGPRTLAIFPKCLIIDGVATHTSKSIGVFHFSMSPISSSHPAIAAPAFFNSSAFLSVKAHIFNTFQLPFGRVIVDLTI
jgi:hypothetical protein